ncbi:hypothetical protein WOLCODRAFT_127398, partial [Wolfiporia cocos MD-104 SS10]
MPRTLEVYNLLGVLPDVRARALTGLRNRAYKLPGGVEPLKTYYMDPPAEPSPAVPYPNLVSLGQASVAEILRRHMEALGGRIEFGTELVSFEQDGACVHARITKKARLGGSDSDEVEVQEETVVASWLVGCDGAKSTVRKLLGMEFKGETRTGEGETRLVIADVEVKGLSVEYWHFWGEFSTILVMLRPTEDEDIFALWVGGQIDYAKVASDREELIKAVRAGTDREDLQIGEVKWLSEFRPNIRMVDRFSEGRVFLVGDAAHVHSPFGAQGLNSGIQDAFNLAWKLALAHRRLAAPGLLSSYTAERQPVIAAMLRKTTALLDATAETMRSREDSERTAQTWDRGGALKQMGVNYRWSAVVLDERAAARGEGAVEGREREPVDPYGYGLVKGGSIRAGERAPDATGLAHVKTDDETSGAETSLFSIFSATRHTLLLFVGAANADELAPIIAQARRYPPDILHPVVIFSSEERLASIEGSGAHLDLDVTLVDREGHAFAGYRCDGDRLTVVVVRPDGVIGGIVYSLKGLEKYFGGVFS